MTWEKFRATWIEDKGILVYGILIPVEEYHSTHLRAGAHIWSFKLDYKYVQTDITQKKAQIDVNGARLRFRELRYVRPNDEGIEIAGDFRTEVEVGNGVQLLTNLLE